MEICFYLKQPTHRSATAESTFFFFLRKLKAIPKSRNYDGLRNEIVQLWFHVFVINTCLARRKIDLFSLEILHVTIRLFLSTKLWKI